MILIWRYKNDSPVKPPLYDLSPLPPPPLLPVLLLRSNLRTHLFPHNKPTPTRTRISLKAYTLHVHVHCITYYPSLLTNPLKYSYDQKWSLSLFPNQAARELHVDESRKQERKGKVQLYSVKL